MSRSTPLLVPFGEWAPDLAPTSAGATRAEGVVADGDGYRPLPRPVAVGPAGLPGAVGDPLVSGPFTFRSRVGNSHTFAGTTSRLWRATRAGWVDATRQPEGATAPQSYASAVPWSMQRWGDVIYAVNGRDPIQRYELDGVGRFEDVPGLPNGLTGRFLAIVGPVLVLGYVVEDLGNTVYSSRVRWAGVSRPESWAVSAATQADFQDLPQIGTLAGITGGEFGAVLGRDGWSRMDFVGPPERMAFRVIEGDVGCDAPGSVVKVGDRTVWLGPRGFRAAAGGPSAAIGAMKVDRHVRRRLAHGTAALDGLRGLALSEEKAVVFAYRSVDAPGSGPALDELLCWSTETGRWSSAREGLDSLGRAALPSSSTDDPDRAGSFTDDPARASRITDDASAAGAGSFPAALVGGGLCALQPSGGVARLATAESEPVPGRRATVLRLRPAVDGAGGATITARVGSREDADDAVSWTGELRREPGGAIKVRKRGRFFRAEVTIAGQFTKALGVRAGAAGAGTR